MAPQLVAVVLDGVAVESRKSDHDDLRSIRVGVGRELLRELVERVFGQQVGIVHYGTGERGKGRHAGIEGALSAGRGVQRGEREQRGKQPALPGGRHPAAPRAHGGPIGFKGAIVPSVPLRTS